MNKKTKVVWITGASSGIGAELARQYSILGVKLILSSRRADILANIKSECSNPENIKSFDLGGYIFNQDMSKDKEWVFIRD